MRFEFKRGRYRCCHRNRIQQGAGRAHADDRRYALRRALGDPEDSAPAGRDLPYRDHLAQRTQEEGYDCVYFHRGWRVGKIANDLRLEKKSIHGRTRQGEIEKLQYKERVEALRVLPIVHSAC